MPEPLALIVIDGAVIVVASVMFPLLRLVASAIPVVELRLVVSVKLWFVVTDSPPAPPNVTAPVARLKSPGPAFTTTALPPLVVRNKELVAVLTPMFPEPEVKVTFDRAEEVATAPVVPLMAPVPRVASVTFPVVEVTVLSAILMPKFATDELIDIAPEVVILLPSVIALLLLKVKLLDVVPPDESTTACRLFTLMAPVVFRVNAGVFVV